MSWKRRSENGSWMEALKLTKAGKKGSRDLYLRTLKSLKVHFGDPIEVNGNRAFFSDMADGAIVKAPLNSKGDTENELELLNSGGLVRSHMGVDVLLISNAVWLAS
jgi:hypothetical protein